MFFCCSHIRVIFLNLLFILLLPFNSFATTAQDGQALYQQCITCHGKNAEGNMALKAPALAGQYAWYLTRQLKNFSREFRGAHPKDLSGQQMLAIASSLDFDQSVPLLTAYIESLTTIKPKSKSAQNMSAQNKSAQNQSIQRQSALKNGSRYYHGKCGACHGGQGEGNKSFNAPNLTGLSSDYLLRQMKHFTEGVRGTNKADKFGRQMAMMAKTTAGAELNDIVFFLTQQNQSQ